MYEIFGREEIVSVPKDTNTIKPQISSSISIKDDLNQKMRTTSLGNSKIVLSDVSNKVKNIVTADSQSHLRSLSPCKSIKKPLSSSELSVLGGRPCKTFGLQSSKRDKSPKNVKAPFTPKPNTKKSGVVSAKVAIFVDNTTDSFLQVPRETDVLASDSELDEVFLPNPDSGLILDSCDAEASPQEIYGYCAGYETPEEDIDGWLLKPMWNNREELANIVGLGQSPESEPEFSDTENFSVPHPALDDATFDNLFAVDRSCISSPPVDVPLADLEW